MHLKEIDSDWSSNHHVTDTGIAWEIIEGQLGRSITDEELLGIRRCFLERLRGEAKANTRLFALIPGVRSSEEEVWTTS